MIDKTREVALKILYRIDNDGAYSNIALNDEIKKNKNLNSKDIGLISEIVYGVTTWKLTLDTIIRKYSSIKLKKISTWILNILRMGIYQVIFLDKIPKSAAVNESVNLAKRYGHRSSSNFVNAILRKIEEKDYKELFEIENDVERISKTTSMPEWIIKELLKEKNVEEVTNICQNSNIRPKISIRVNFLKISKDELKKKLEKQKIKVSDGISEEFLIIENLKSIEKIEEFKEGLFTVQDEAAGLTAKILNPKPGEIVLDACSAPGGKTTFMAEIMKNKGKIDAWDIHEHRIKLVEENAKRLGINIINTRVNDATKYDEKNKEKYEKILLDVPCLGIGVLKRKPDIKWQKNEESINEIKKIQFKILENCSKYLKTGGELVYSTCSILKEENENVVEKFIKEHKNYEVEKLDITEEMCFKKFIKNERYLKVYQNKKTDGFFICKILKTKE